MSQAELDVVVKKAAAAKEAAIAAVEEKALAAQTAKQTPPPAPTAAPVPKATPAPVPKAAPTPSAGLGVVTGKESGGRVLPKEEVSADLLNMLKKYN